MISEERVEKAVEFLRDTAEQYGQTRGHLAYCDANMRRVKSLEIMESRGIEDGQKGRSVAIMEVEAYASDAYLTAMLELQNSSADYETLRAKREAAVMTIEVFRSQNSARKAGIKL